MGTGAQQTLLLAGEDTDPGAPVADEATGVGVLTGEADMVGGEAIIRGGGVVTPAANGDRAAALRRAVGCLACLDQYARRVEVTAVCHSEPHLWVDGTAHAVEDHEQGAVRVGHQRRIDDGVIPAEVEVIAV